MDNKLGLGALTALVIGSMIGAGVFSLPQNMALVASPAAVMIGWMITGIGMIFLALSFQYLTIIKPEINSGVFGYAQAGFGDYIGFCSAWGYWLSAMLANVSYLVIVFSTLGMFFDKPNDVIFGLGNTWQSVVGASIILWLVHFLILRGVKTAAKINMVTTIAKLVPLFLFVFFTMLAFKWHTFIFDFTGIEFGSKHDLLDQVKSTMLITVWVFIGVEGAVVVSSRARDRKDIGRATILGLLTALIIYIFVTLLSMGIISTPELAKLQNPSTAKILEHILGPWGAVLIGCGLLISVCGAFLSWTVLATEAPFLAANNNVFPKIYKKQNEAGTAVTSLNLTTICIQVSLFVVTFAGGTYNSILVIASEMILIPYFLVAAYTLKIAIQTKNRGSLLWVGIFATVYGIWLLYASGLHHLLLSAILYLPGVFFFIKAKREQNKPIFVGREIYFVLFLITISAFGIYLLVTGKLVI
ncbi:MULTISPECIES: basic amino acid/polyamine antiporter [unclassified Photobacterium]|uniref:basic amino acid/polyamine antiporter n=1 Tax=unclassified Photobacterium TaxID=2628852 RepID=UPI000D157724|nr:MULTISPECIES: basic amino acid/polyamine antiporter [unclassified Photobacterium]PSV27565.1 arginine:ornithine antiporter [Photobacterium sp. GB-56]PSV28584.1 arginine:ornithine antiporter [Photobacterium sp. GB-72]PSV34594.1 arginine:ornithine antiporter [Photobacterium sp. GB-210]PSV37237.1 arginine:ornithine antiporter [Photobacterium sp. GB-27]PSV44568.1 arginine:ornithine antiporter [Photobacterium sp. GB-36]